MATLTVADLLDAGGETPIDDAANWKDAHKHNVRVRLRRSILRLRRSMTINEGNIRLAALIDLINKLIAEIPPRRQGVSTMPRLIDLRTRLEALTFPDLNMILRSSAPGATDDEILRTALSVMRRRIASFDWEWST